MLLFICFQNQIEKIENLGCFPNLRYGQLLPPRSSFSMVRGEWDSLLPLAEPGGFELQLLTAWCCWLCPWGPWRPPHLTPLPFLCSAGSSPWLETASAEWRTCRPCDTCVSWTCPTTRYRHWTQVGGRNGSGRGLGLPDKCLEYRRNAGRPLLQALPGPLTLRSQPEPQQSHPGAGLRVPA